MANIQVPTGDMHRKMKIESIHKKGAKIWITAYLFYDKEQLEKLNLAPS
jgi:hypothetical protein